MSKADNDKVNGWVHHHEAFQDHVLYVEKDMVSHVYENKDRGGYSLSTRPFGGWFSDMPTQHFDTLEQAKGMGNVHGWTYQAQQKAALQEMAKEHDKQSKLNEFFNRAAPGPSDGRER